MSAAVIGGVMEIGRTLIKRLIPDPEQQAKAELALADLQQSGKLKELETRMSAILAEAQSKDAWTSRARPSFMYVMYLMILSSIPMGILHAFSPETATAIADGMKAWLAAIPSEMWTLFGVGYVGYSAMRTVDKRRG